MFRRIDHVALHVSDLQRSIDFYEKHFGFKKYFSYGGEGAEGKGLAQSRLSRAGRRADRTQGITEEKATGSNVQGSTFKVQCKP